MRAVLVFFLFLVTQRHALRSLSPIMVLQLDFASLKPSFWA
jgi:hypothetical protein